MRWSMFQPATFENEREQARDLKSENKVKKLRQKKKRLEINCKHNDQFCVVFYSLESLTMCKKKRRQQAKQLDKLREEKLLIFNESQSGFLSLRPVKWKFHLNSFISIWWVFSHSLLFHNFYVRYRWLSLASMRNQKKLLSIVQLSLHWMNMELFFLIKLNFIKMIFCFIFWFSRVFFSLLLRLQICIHFIMRNQCNTMI